MSIEAIIALIGIFGTVALSINAFFLSGIYSKQGDIELKVMRLIVKEEEKDKRLEKLEMFKSEIRERVSTLEGVLPTVQKYLEQNH